MARGALGIVTRVVDGVGVEKQAGKEKAVARARAAAREQPAAAGRLLGKRKR